MTDRGTLVLRWREGLHPAYVLSLLGFIGVLALIAQREGQFQPVHRFAMGSGAIGLAYALAVQLLNATRLSRQGATLHLKHGPLPWRRRLAVPVEAIASLRCDPYSRRVILRTRIGEEVVVAENLSAARLPVIDEGLRALLTDG